MKGYIERALAAFRYDPETGVITRLETRGGQRAGSKVGTVRKDGYLSTKFLHREVLAHRLAWILHYQEFPGSEIDHVNGDRSDNRIANLRLACRQTNNQNRRKAHSNNELGVLGVRQVREGVFVARIRVSKKAIHLGHFSSAELASEAYLEAKRALHKGNTL